MGKTKQILLVIIIALAMMLSSCESDASLQTAEYKGSITVGYYPGSYLNEPVVNIIRAIAGQMGLEIYLKDQTEGTWEADLHNDVIDIMIDVESGDDLLSDSLFSTQVLFIKNPNANLAEGGLVGVMDVGFISESADAVTDFHNGEYVYYALEEMLVKDFQSGYLDGIIINQVNYLTYGSLDGLTYDTVNRRDILVVFESTDMALRDEFNKRLAQLSESGVLKSIIYGN